MKNYILFIVINLLFFTLLYGQKTTVLFVHERSGDSALVNAVSKKLESAVISDLKKEFPCLEVITREQITNKLKYLREMALLGNPASYTIEDVGKSYNTDYMFILKTTQATSDMLRLEVLCYHKKEVAAFEWANAFSSPDSYSEDCESLSKALMERLKRFELCYFRGDVTLTVETERDTAVISEYMVYCDGFDRQFRKKENFESRTKTVWKLKKTNTEHAEGDVTIFMYEEKSIEEDNPCYKCQSGREGGRSYKYNSTFNVDSEGISTESIFDGKPHADARIKLYFEDNGTFNITINATSKLFTDKENVEIEATGTCDNIPRETRTENRDVNVFTNQTFYSFPGKSTDLSLSNSEIKSWIDPVTREKTTVTIEINLSKQ